MTITQTKKEDSIVLKIEGWLDVNTTPELQQYLENLEQTETLIFDFDELEYISSAGVRTVVASYRKQKENERIFQVINANREVFEVFAMTGLTAKIDIKEK